MTRVSHGRVCVLAVSLLVSSLFACSGTRAEIAVSSDVFVGGGEGPLGTSNYRIPAFVVSPDGSLLAFAEGRRSGNDPGAAGLPIDMVSKRSTDGGQTWQPLQVIHSDARFDYSDPRPVVDSETGNVVLLYTQWPDACGQSCVPTGLGPESSIIYVRTSSDNGVTWSEAVDINQQVKDPSWFALNTGPGKGIQLQWQTTMSSNGRLVVPGHHKNAAGEFRPLSLYSDDGGTSWRAGNPVGGPSANESEIVELTNGQLYLDGRPSSGSARRRFFSQDGGLTWGANIPGDIVVTPVDTALARFSAVRNGEDRDRLLYTAPLGTPAGAGNNRTSLGIWTSYDEGQTFINPIQLADGHAAYSALDKLADGSIGVVYEATGSTLIRFLSFDMAHLEGIQHAAATSQYDGFGNRVDPLRGGLGWSGSWNANGVDVRGDGGLEFLSFRIEGESSRATMRGGQATRELATPVALDTPASYFLSMFVRSDTDSGDLGALESLDVRLTAGGTQQFAFGVNSQEAFYVQNKSTNVPVTSPVNSLAQDQEYLLLVKILATDDPGSADQIFLAAYDSPANVPEDEESIQWLVTGETSDFSSTIDSISLSGGAEANWNIDAVRIGISLDGVIYSNGINGIEGDLNQDGSLDDLDIDTFVAGWRTSGHQTLLEKYMHGDLNFDGITNLPDAFLFHEILVDNGSAFPFERLPEPSGGLLLVCGGLLAVRPRRRGDDKTVVRRTTAP